MKLPENAHGDEKVPQLRQPMHLPVARAFHVQIVVAAVARLALRLVEVHHRLVERAVGSGRYVGETRTDALRHTPQMELP